jgi:LCP family protein required for cell wall assembly
MEKERFKRRINVGTYAPKTEARYPVISSADKSKTEDDFSLDKNILQGSVISRDSFSMDLPGGESKIKNLVIKKQLGPQIKSWSFRVTSIVMILTILSGGLLFTQSYINIHKTLEGNSKTVAALQPNVNPDLLKGEQSGRVNVLVMGRGGSSNALGDATDTMMLVSIDSIDSSAVIISIPKDLWVNVPNQPPMKLSQVWENAEYNYQNKDLYGNTDPNAIAAANKQVDQVVENIIGVPVNYNVIANFDSLKYIVNSVGGITLNVPKEVYDYTLAKENGGTGVIAQPGWRTFTGQQALNYLRSKATTSDASRNARQRAMLEALKQKIETLGLVSTSEKISQLISSLGANVQTDLNIRDANSLYNLAKGVEPSNITSIGLGDTSNNLLMKQYITGQSVEVPRVAIFNYSAIQTYVRSQLPDPYITKENAPILILNGSTNPSAASLLDTELQSYGYNVVGMGNAPTTNYSHTEVININGVKDKYTNHFLDQRFKTTTKTSLPDNSIQTNGAAFVIIIGNDETFNSQS